MQPRFLPLDGAPAALDADAAPRVTEAVAATGRRMTGAARGAPCHVRPPARRLALADGTLRSLA
jgi:hypothetical protein